MWSSAAKNNYSFIIHVRQILVLSGSLSESVFSNQISEIFASQSYRGQKSSVLARLQYSCFLTILTRRIVNPYVFYSNRLSLYHVFTLCEYFQIISHNRSKCSTFYNFLLYLYVWIVRDVSLSRNDHSNIPISGTIATSTYLDLTC